MCRIMRGIGKIGSVKIDEDNLVLPKLRYGAAAMEDEMLKLPKGGAELVACGYGRNRGCTGTIANT